MGVGETPREEARKDGLSSPGPLPDVRPVDIDMATISHQMAASRHLLPADEMAAADVPVSSLPVP